jgi:hypothetical protein
MTNADLCLEELERELARILSALDSPMQGVEGLEAAQAALERCAATWRAMDETRTAPRSMHEQIALARLATLVATAREQTLRELARTSQGFEFVRVARERLAHLSDAPISGESCDANA